MPESELPELSQERQPVLVPERPGQPESEQSPGRPESERPDSEQPEQHQA